MSKTVGVKSGGESTFAPGFRSGYPGAYGTFLRDAVVGKGDEEFTERPEFTLHKMAMVGQGRSGLMAEYDGISTRYLSLSFRLVC